VEPGQLNGITVLDYWLDDPGFESQQGG